MKKRTGFTLIELLAVIVILAIIALIAVPTIMNVINKANKSAFKDTAYGIISAGELYYAEQQLELNGMSEDAEFVWPNDIGTLQVKGNVPDGTVLHVNTNGETALAMSNGRYCVTKEYSDNDITITEDYTECNIPGGEGNAAKTLSALATTSTTLGIDSVAACATSGTCEAGTSFAIKVNDEDTYKFRVLSDENNVVTLIMSGNLYAEGNITEHDVAWSVDVCETIEDDSDGNGIIDEELGESWKECYNTTGPTTALKALKERTSNWTNIEEYSYTLEDQDGIYTYFGEYVQNVRARLPRLSDIITDAIGCTEHDATCPNWIYEGLYNTGDNNTYGYWLSDASSYEAYAAWYVYYDGYAGANGNVAIATDYGVRPVITITK